MLAGRTKFPERDTNSLPDTLGQTTLPRAGVVVFGLGKRELSLPRPMAHGPRLPLPSQLRVTPSGPLPRSPDSEEPSAEECLGLALVSAAPQTADGRRWPQMPLN